MKMSRFALFVFLLTSSGRLAASETSWGEAPSLEGHWDDPSQAPFSLGGYVEAFYQWNFNVPANGITNFRGFDNRHNSFTLSNVALDAQWDDEALLGRLTLQVGHTPATYYLDEPERAGTESSNATSAELWRLLQQAYVGYRFGDQQELTVAAGLFLSPIGPENIAVHENWNWSRSNLFFGLPFYHTGVQATYALSSSWRATVAGYNGWNSVVDNNTEKSISGQLAFEQREVRLSLLYFGGVERPASAPEGRPWRHLFDVYCLWHVSPRLSLLAQGNAGFETNRFGVSRWAAGALYGRVRVVEPLFLAVRSDMFFEHAPGGDAGAAQTIFWPAPWVASQTATVDVRPHERVSMRLEYRHDRAGEAMYFGSTVAGDGFDVPFEPNRQSQHTLTLGATSWF